MRLMRTSAAPDVAAQRLRALSRRWLHVQGVGRLAEQLAAKSMVSAEVVAASWLHDLGYAPSVARTGFHPLDGARFLQYQGISPDVVALVAHHTGAAFEAEERGLVDELDELPLPDPVELDVLTLLDLVVGPSGDLTTPEQRIEEILTRYGADDPVHRAVARSRTSLLESAERARAQLGLSDEWPLDVAEGALES